MRYHILAIIVGIIICLSTAYSNQNKPLIFSPFIDFSYDVHSNNWDYYPYYYEYNSYDGTNLALGANIFYKPFFAQLQIANYLRALRYDDDIFGIIRAGMVEEINKNGFLEMGFSYTDNFVQDYRHTAYSGAVGYYHLIKPVDTLRSGYFSLGINLGFTNYNYWDWYWYWDWNNELIRYPYLNNYTTFHTLAEIAWINRYIKPYIAFGFQNILNDDYSIYPHKSGFFSIGIQAHITNILPYFSGSQTKLTNNNHGWREIINVYKPNIYLYPKSTLHAKVKLLPQKGNEITVSIPPYNNGWDVTINPNSIIDNQYEYLFYEGKLTEKPTNEFGWSISASDLWQFLPEKMFDYGFNEKEINDFIDYWKLHLPKSNFYDIIPLVNQEIENEFSLVVEPKPDVILRVWFYIKPTNSNKELHPPSVPQFERKGFTVTEWGVLVAK